MAYYGILIYGVDANLITEYYAVANYIHLLCLNITEISKHEDYSHNHEYILTALGVFATPR